jgi:hypothetical protein
VPILVDPTLEALKRDWCERRLTTSAIDILVQIKHRSSERGLHVVDGASIVMLALWSLLLWENKIGLVALERSGVDRFELARGLDRLLKDKGLEHPVVYDRPQGALVMAKTRQPYEEWDLSTLIEPILSAAEHESKELGHNWIGSEHLVLSILRVSDPELSGLLSQHGASYEQVKRAVVEVLTS